MLGLSHEDLLRILRYDPETGIWTWRVAITYRHVIDKRADIQTDKRGYRHLSLAVNGRQHRCYSHRLAVFYMTGKKPPRDVDHADGNKAHNAWKNLRVATRAQNNANAKRPKNNTSGFKGVSRISEKQWRAYITYNKRQISLGYFDCPAAAHFAYLVAAHEYYDVFAVSEPVR